MDSNWQIDRLIHHGRCDSTALNQFINEIETEMRAIETSLVAIEDHPKDKMSPLEIGFLHASATHLEKYKAVLDELIESGAGLPKREEEFTKKFYHRQIFLVIVGMTAFIGSLIVANTDTSEKTKKGFLWVDSFLLLLLGVQNIWQNCKKSRRVIEKNDWQYLQDLSFSIRTVLALQAVYKRKDKVFKSHERIQQSRLKYGRNPLNMREPLLQKTQIGHVIIVQSAPVTDNELSENDF